MSKAIVVEEGVLAGKIGSEGTLSGSIVSEGTLRGSLSIPIGYEDYPGPCKVTSEGTLTGKIESEGALSGSIVSEIKVITKDGALYENYNCGWAR